MGGWFTNIAIRGDCDSCNGAYYFSQRVNDFIANNCCVVYFFVFIVNIVIVMKRGFEYQMSESTVYCFFC